MWPAHFFAFVPFRALSFRLLKFHELLAQLAQPMVALKAGSMSSSSDTNTLILDLAVTYSNIQPHFHCVTLMIDAKKKSTENNDAGYITNQSY